MTSFNAVSAIMTLDDYYDKCVEPKISIPKRYPGVTSSGFKRQAARLRSYKEIDAMNDDEQEYEDDEDNENSQKYDEAPFIDSPIYESNESQIDFEINDFNRLYDEVDDNGSHGHEQMPANSAQWRIQPNNVNRPAGSAPLVPNNYRGRGRRRNRYNQNNNNLRGSVHSRLGYNMNMRNQQQGMLNAYNNFSNQGGRAPQQVVTNINAHFDQGQGAQMEYNSLTSLINSANHIHENTNNYSFNGCAQLPLKLPDQQIQVPMISGFEQKDDSGNNNVRLVDLLNLGNSSSFSSLDQNEIRKNMILLMQRLNQDNTENNTDSERQNFF